MGEAIQVADGRNSCFCLAPTRKKWVVIIQMWGQGENHGPGPYLTVIAFAQQHAAEIYPYIGGEYYHGINTAINYEKNPIYVCPLK